MNAGAPLTGVILAGGRAKRLGGIPKGLELVGGARMIDHVAEALRTVTSDLLIVANAPDAAAWLPDVRVERDVIPDCGSLGGVHAALSHANGDVLVVAWDMPFVTPALLRALAEASPEHAAIVPLGSDGIEPLCARYAASCRAVAERLLARGERRARALAESVSSMVIEPPIDPRFGDRYTQLLSINTKLELERARDSSIRGDRS